jgi:hypothetical protein
MMPVSRQAVFFRSIVFIALLISFPLFLTKCVVAQDSTPGAVVTQTAAASGEQQNAQTATTSTPESTAAPTATSEPGSTSQSPITNKDLSFALIAFGAALIATLLLLLFVRWSFGASLLALVSMARRGHNVSPEFVVATMQATDAGNALFKSANADAVATYSLIVTGPQVLPIGTNSKYTVKPSDASVALPQLSWSKVVTDRPDPVLAITINEKGSEASIHPHSPGSFKLRIAAVGDGADQWQECFSDLIAQDVSESEKGGLKIPFFGHGYGSQILALFLLAVIAILGMSERISSDAIAGVLGAIAGYIFGTTVGARRDD